MEEDSMYNIPLISHICPEKGSGRSSLGLCSSSAAPRLLCALLCASGSGGKQARFCSALSLTPTGTRSLVWHTERVGEEMDVERSHRARFKIFNHLNGSSLNGTSHLPLWYTFIPQIQLTHVSSPWISTSSPPDVPHWVRAMLCRGISNKEHSAAAARQSFCLYLIYKYSHAQGSLFSIPFSVFVSCFGHNRSLMPQFSHVWVHSVLSPVIYLCVKSAYRCLCPLPTLALDAISFLLLLSHPLCPHKDQMKSESDVCQ